MGDKAQEWQARLDGLIERARAEVSGERGRRVRRGLEQAREQVDEALHSPSVENIRREAAELGDKALAAVDDAIKSDKASGVMDRVDAAAAKLGSRIQRVIGGDEDPPDPRDDSTA